MEKILALECGMPYLGAGCEWGGFVAGRGQENLKLSLGPRIVITSCRLGSGDDEQSANDMPSRDGRSRRQGGDRARQEFGNVQKRFLLTGLLCGEECAQRLKGLRSLSCLGLASTSQKEMWVPLYPGATGLIQDRFSLLYERLRLEDCP
jgi:hypothetical protein